MKKLYFYMAALAVIAGCSNQFPDTYEGPYSKSNTPSSEYENPDFVDLGLSVKWAKCNLGAENSYDRGTYYRWGDTEGFNVDAKTGTLPFTWDTCPFVDNGDTTSFTKYNYKYAYGTVDYKYTLDPADDAATCTNSSWRMPTHTEFRELIDNATWTSTALEGINGYMIASKKNPDNWIFLPTTGYINEKTRYDKDAVFAYWTSSLTISNSYYPTQAVSATATTSDAGLNRNYNWRFFGMAIRPVKD